MKKKAVIIVTFIAIMLLLSTASLGCSQSMDKIAVISLSGPITADSGGFIWGQTVTPQLVREYLKQAGDDGAVKAIVLKVQSPGGTVAACQEIVREIEATSKPIVISMADIAASGGYYISAKADKIVASPGTLTGSIGVIAQIPNLGGLYEKLGIEMEVFKSGKYKDMYSGIRELTLEEREIMQEITDQSYEQFIQVIVEGRGLSEAKVRSLATGQLYTGVRVKELGLVDELGGFEAAIDLAAKLAGVSKPQIEYYGGTSWFEMLSGFSIGEWRSLVQMRLLGAENTLVLNALTHLYFQPMYIYQ